MTRIEKKIEKFCNEKCTYNALSDIEDAIVDNFSDILEGMDTEEEEEYIFITFGVSTTRTFYDVQLVIEQNENGEYEIADYSIDRLE